MQYDPRKALILCEDPKLYPGYFKVGARRFEGPSEECRYLHVASPKSDDATQEAWDKFVETNGTFVDECFQSEVHMSSEDFQQAVGQWGETGLVPTLFLYQR